MSARPFYETVYHHKDFTLADAFRPMPPGVMWGRRCFTIPATALAGCTEHELLLGAHESAPEGYRLTKLSLYPENGPERVIWSTPADARMDPKREVVAVRVEIREVAND